MLLELLRVARRLPLAAMALLLCALASAHRAQDFLRQQDFQSSPPQLTGLVESWVDWVGFGTYERAGAQPFAAPVPPGLPADVTHIYIDIDSGGYVKPNGCLYVWRETFVWLEFSDGSEFVWWHTATSLSCPDGSEETFDNVISTAGVTDPTNGAWSGWVRSYSRENLNVQRRASLRGAAGSTVSLSSLAAAPRPWIGAEVDSFDITLAPGATLDLRGLDGVQGPCFESNAPILVRCDQILLDPGVVLPELFSLPPTVAPGEVVREVVLLGRASEFVASSPTPIPMRVANLGNASESVLLDWIDVLAWSFGPPQMATLEPLATSAFQFSAQRPAPTPPGVESALQVRAHFAGQTVTHPNVLVSAHPAPAAPQVYCTAKLNSQGCTPAIGASGLPTLSGYDDFVVRAANVLPDRAGIVFYGSSPSSAPFQGGVLCVQQPVARTPVRFAASGFGAAPCDGAYSFHMSQAFLRARGVTAGQSLYLQWWTRDPQAPHATGLTDAASVTVGP